MDWLMEFVGDQLDLGQFGGMKGGSISHYLIEFTNFVLHNPDMKNPQAVIALLVDFLKAFNRQNHNIIIRFVSDLGVPAWLLRLIASFFYTKRAYFEIQRKQFREKPSGNKTGDVPVLNPNQFCRI